MSFKEDHPNFMLYNESHDYYFNEVPYSAWSELESLIMEGGGEQLHHLVQLLSTKVSAGNVTGSAIQFIPEVIAKLKDKVEGGRYDLFMDCLGMLCTEGELEISALNDFLEDNRIGYVAEREGWCSHIIWNKIEDIKENKSNKNIELALAESVSNDITSGGGINKMDKKNKTKIFITHSSDDAQYVKILTDLLENMKVPTECIVCTTIPQYKIPNGINAYEWLKKQFKENYLHMIFVLSEHYFNSIPCLNEMGAAWITAEKKDLLLLSGFSYNDLKSKKGCLDTNIQGVCMDDSDDAIKAWLIELRNDVIAEFNLSEIHEVKWEEYRDKFMKEMKFVSRGNAFPGFDW